MRVSGDGTTPYFRPAPAKAAENQAMNVDGSNARRIADRALVAIPNISPDGRYQSLTSEIRHKTAQMWALSGQTRGKSRARSAR